MLEKYRVHEVAKDLGVPTKEVVDLLGSRVPGERKSMTALNETELSVVLNHYTNQNQVENFEEYFSAGHAKKEAAAAECVGLSNKRADNSLLSYFEKKTSDDAYHVRGRPSVSECCL